MKLTKSIAKLLTGAILGVLILVGVHGIVKAASNCVPYDPNSSISKPIFNYFCNVPQGIGNEPDFVRIRQNKTGNNEDNKNNPDYVNVLNKACVSGDNFDVWTYVHNNAASGFNKNGSGSAVAHNVMLQLSAPLGATKNSFNFTSAISASNAPGVQDSATLNCGKGNNVKLTLVPSTVHIYSQQYNWHNLPDSSVNSTFKIGSPVMGSGNQWGCWEYRIVVVYTVKVTKQPQPPVPAVCTALNVTEHADRRITVESVDFKANDSTVTSVRIDYGDGNVETVKTTDLPKDHTYTNDGTFKITATLLTNKGEVTSESCTHSVTFKAKQPVTPPTTSLPNTGSNVGGLVGIFTATSLAGAFLHRKWMLRRS